MQRPRVAELTYAELSNLARNLARIPPALPVRGPMAEASTASYYFKCTRFFFIMPVVDDPGTRLHTCAMLAGGRLACHPPALHDWLKPPLS
jgi:hypothetical protein